MPTTQPPVHITTTPPVQTTATSTAAPTTTEAPELGVVCSFDDPVRRLSCEAVGHRDRSLRWTTSLTSGWQSGTTYEHTLSWGEFVDEITVQVDACRGSTCSIVTTTIDLDLQPRGDCPDDFAAWFGTFPLGDVDQVTQVGPPARILGSVYEPFGHFRVPDWKNEVEVRLPIDATLYEGSSYLAYSAFRGENPDHLDEVQYSLRFHSPCEGLRIEFGHVLEVAPGLKAIFDDLPLSEHTGTHAIGPLQMSEGDLLGTSIGFALDGNAFMAFGVHDDLSRVPTAQHPQFYNAACYYDFFTVEIAANLRSKTLHHEPVEPGVCP